MKFLFWNMQKKELSDQLAELILENRPDIACFAESTPEIIETALSTVSKTSTLNYSLIENPGCDKLIIITHLDKTHFDLLNQSKDFSLLKFIPGEINSIKLIIGFVHLPSKLNHSLDQIRRATEKLKSQVFDEEKSHYISDSIIMGDFNVDPFESPMVSFYGMGASNGIDCSQRDTITCSGESNRLFYNPMWTLYSSNKDYPGTLKYARTGEDVVSWHFLDQVIIRPSLIEKFSFDSLSIMEA